MGEIDKTDEHPYEYRRFYEGVLIGCLIGIPLWILILYCLVKAWHFVANYLFP